MFARSRALLIAMPDWKAYIWRASQPQGPGWRPLVGRSTDITPISSLPTVWEAYMGA